MGRDTLFLCFLPQTGFLAGLEELGFLIMDMLLDETILRDKAETSGKR